MSHPTLCLQRPHDPLFSHLPRPPLHRPNTSPFSIVVTALRVAFSRSLPVARLHTNAQIQSSINAIPFLPEFMLICAPCFPRFIIYFLFCLACISISLNAKRFYLLFASLDRSFPILTSLASYSKLSEFLDSRTPVSQTSRPYISSDLRIRD